MEYPDTLRGRQSPLDKHGLCPACNTNWDSGDMLDVLGKLAVFANKRPDEVAKIASSYGWTPGNKARFSNVIIVTFPIAPNRPAETTFYQCPRCIVTFNALTGEKFNSLIDARESLNNGSDNTELHNDFEE